MASGIRPARPNGSEGPGKSGNHRGLRSKPVKQLGEGDGCRRGGAVHEWGPNEWSMMEGSRRRSGTPTFHLVAAGQAAVRRIREGSGVAMLQRCPFGAKRDRSGGHLGQSATAGPLRATSTEVPWAHRSTVRIVAWLAPLGVWFLWLQHAWPFTVFFRSVPAGEDTLEVMWALAWYRRALVELHVSPLFHPLAFAPQGWHVAKQHHGPFLIGLMLPWAWLGGDAFAFHVLAWLAFSMAFVGAFRLAGLFVRDRGLATAVGVAYAAFNGTLAAMQVYGDYLTVAWGTACLPLMGFALEKARRARWAPRWLIRAGVAWGLGIAGNPYLVLLGGGIVLIYAWRALRQRQRGRFLMLPGIALLVSGPWLALFLHAFLQDRMLGQTVGTALGNGYPWAHMLIWNPYHPWLRWHSALPARPILTLGMVPAGTSLLGLLWAAGRRCRLRSQPWLRAALFGALLATGIAVHWEEPLRIPWPSELAAFYEAIWRIGHARKPDLFLEPTLPSDWYHLALTPLLLLWAIVPFWEVVGTVWRFIAMTALGLMVAGAEAWGRIASPWLRRGLAGLWIFEALIKPLPTLPWPYPVHPAFEWLRQNPEPGAVIDAFADHTPGLYLSRVAVMATEYHRRPTLSGFTPFHPRWVELLQRGRGLLFRHRPDWLGQHGFRFLVVHHPPPDWAKWNWPFPLEKCFDPPPVPSPWNERICIFRIPDHGEPELTNLWLLDGWSGPERWGIWAAGVEAHALWLADPLREPAVLELIAFPLCVPGKVQRLEVFLNGQLLGEESFADCREQTIRWQIPLRWAQTGVNELLFRFAYAVSPPTGEPRRLAVGFRRLWIRPAH